MRSFKILEFIDFARNVSRGITPREHLFHFWPNSETSGNPIFPEVESWHPL